MEKKLLLIGGGSHCHSVLDSVLSSSTYNEIGIIDFTDSSFLGVSVVGNDNDIPALVNEGWTDAFITIGSVGDTSMRRRLYDMVKMYGLIIPTIIDSTAIIAQGVEINEGVFVGKKAVINAGTRIDTCAIINTGAIIEHDCKIEAFSHVSSGATICGSVKIGEDSHIGAGSVVRQMVEIGKKSLIGAGSVVVKNIPDNVKAFGNPCKVVD